MTHTHTPAVVAVFESRGQAGEAVAELRRAGFREDEIGLLGPHGGTLGHDATHTHWEEGSGLGAAAGAVTGTGLGLAVAAGLIPGVGPVIAGGTLLALLASAGAGAAVGTIVGGLIGLGIPEEDSKFYEGEVTAGRTLVTVRSGSRSADAWRILSRCGAHERAGAAATYGTAVEATPY